MGRTYIGAHASTYTYKSLYIKKNIIKYKENRILCKYNEDERKGNLQRVQNGSGRPCLLCFASRRITGDICLVERFAPKTVDGPVKREEVSLLACVILLQHKGHTKNFLESLEALPMSSACHLLSGGREL